MARLRSRPAAHPSSPKTRTTRRALQEKTNTAHVNTDAKRDIVEDGFIKDTKPRRGRSRKHEQDEREFFMVGGLGSSENARSDPAAVTVELAKSSRIQALIAEDDARAKEMKAKARDNEAQSEIVRRKGTRGKSSTVQGSKTKRNRSAANAKLATPTAAPHSPACSPSSAVGADKPQAAHTQRSGFSRLPSPPHDGQSNASVSKRSPMVQPLSVLRSTSTPAAEGTSILALKNFKRRPRQPSILAMVQQRTASARPSAVQACKDTSYLLADADAEDEIDEDFAPEAEGTPLHLDKLALQISSRDPNEQPLPRFGDDIEDTTTNNHLKRKSKAFDGQNAADSMRQAKRPKAKEGPRPQDPLSLRESQPSSAKLLRREKTPQLESTSEVQVIGSSEPPSSLLSGQASPSRPEVLNDEGIIICAADHAERKQFVPVRDLNYDTTSDIQNGTMAEPESSSPSAEQPALQLGDRVSSLRLQHAASKQKVKPMTTATLQSLLPKRRRGLRGRHRTADYEIRLESDSDGGAHDGGEDREQYTNRANRRSRSRKSKTKRFVSATKTRESESAPRARKSAPKPARSTVRKTYARTAASDKENEFRESDGSENEDTAELPEVSMLEATQSKELEEAKKRFAEVDDWDLTFESMSGDEHRSSSQGWR